MKRHHKFFNFLLSLLDSEITKQIVKYAYVGIAVNLTGYLIYLLVTYYWFTPRVAVTVLYCFGVIASFIGNKRLTFSFAGNFTRCLVKYIIVHLIGYFINLLILTAFVYSYGYPHQLVQLVAILIVAIYLFIAQKFFVFKGIH